MKFIRIILLILVFFTLARVAFAEPFTVTLSANGDSRTYTYDNVSDAIDSFSNSSLEQMLPSYTAGSPATASVNLRGLDATLSYPTSGSTLVLDIPSINVRRTFTGATRDESQNQLEDFFKGADGNGVLTRVLQALAAETPIDPVAGNPNALLSRMGDKDFERGTDAREGFNVTTYRDDKNEFGFGVDTGWFTTDVADQEVTTATLAYSRRLPDHNFSLLFDMPLMYTTSEGAEAYSGSLGAGIRVPLGKQWALTPILRAGVIGSTDLGAAAVIYSGSVTSDYRIPLSPGNEFQIGNMVGYYKTDGITVGDYNIDYDLSNVRLKNGVAINHKFGSVGSGLTGRVFFNDSRFFGDELFIDSYEEVGVAAIKPLGKTTSVQLGTSYLFAGDYDGAKINLDIRF